MNINDVFNKDKSEFLSIVEQIIDKYGVPERFYADNGANIVIATHNKAHNKVKAFPVAKSAKNKHIEKIFGEINKEPESSYRISMIHKHRKLIAKQSFVTLKANRDDLAAAIKKYGVPRKLTVNK